MKITELSPLVKRLTAGNASVFTGPGTNTYIVGKENFTVIDPGPAIEEHIKDIVKVCGEDLSQILVTHTHPCLLYTSDADDDLRCLDLGGGRWIE